ncbi:MAG: hypothetical protein KJN63_06805 [Acidimicrobiia bacterium]|nr:hypothetical protein [Acidimicrobiia bacterium]
MALRSEPPEPEPVHIATEGPVVVSVPTAVPVLTPGLARALARIIHRAAALDTDRHSCQGCDLSSKAS